MAFSIKPKSIIINPTPTFLGTYDTGVSFASLNLRATFNGRTYIPAFTSNGNWHVAITEPLTTNGLYTLSVTGNNVNASMTTDYEGPLFAGDEPTFTIPSNDAEVAAVAAVANTTQTQFMQMTAETSSSCDLMGTVQGLASELSRTVRNQLGEVIGVIKESTASLTASIRSTLGDAFGGSGGFLNKIKGYASTAVSWAADVKNSAMEAAGEAVAWARDKIQAAQAQIAEWMDLGEEGESKIYNLIKSTRSAIQSATNAVGDFISSAQTKLTGLMSGIKTAAANLQGMITNIRSQMTAMVNIVGEAVTGISQATCGAIANVLAGSPSDAFSNITSGATDVATKAFGAAKDVFNEGASNIGDVMEKIVDSTGIGDVFGNIKDAATGIATSVMDASSSFIDATSDGAKSLYSIISSRPKLV